jgi:hypothetical protein
MLVAQCMPSAPCELPTGLPWYFGLVIAAIWLAVVVGAVRIARRLLLARRERRAAGADHPRDARTPGDGVEPW